MSLTKFITDMLNIEPDQIEKLDSLNCKTQRKGSIAINQARKYVL